MDVARFILYLRPFKTYTYMYKVFMLHRNNLYIREESSNLE